jgi:hypothetical protein
MVLPFKYKEARLRGLGATTSPRNIHWLLFLESEIIDDREELAKCIRTFKRELQKEFPELKGAVQSERIVYLPCISGEEPCAVDSLEVLPDVYYVGPQARMDDEDKSLRNIDCTLSNCRQLEQILPQPE